MEQKPCCASLEQEFAFFVQQKRRKFNRIRRVVAWLNYIFSQLGEAISSSFRFNLEPHIQKHQDRQGNPYYRVYDPIERAHHTFTSEESVRIWLEGRYHK